MWYHNTCCFVCCRLLGLFGVVLMYKESGGCVGYFDEECGLKIGR